MNEITTNILNLVLPTAVPSGGPERHGGERGVVQPETSPMPDQRGSANSAPARQDRDERPREGQSAGRRGRARQAHARRSADEQAEGRAARQRRGRLGRSAAAAQEPARLPNGKGAVAEASSGLAVNSSFAALLRMVVGSGAAGAMTGQPPWAKPGLAKGQPQGRVAGQPNAAGPDVPKAVAAAGARAVAQAAPVAANATTVAQMPPAEGKSNPVAQAAQGEGKVSSVAQAVPAAGKGATVAQAAAQPKAEGPAGQAELAPPAQAPEGGKAGQATDKNVSAGPSQASADQVLPARAAVAKQQTSQPQAAAAVEPPSSAATMPEGAAARAAPVAVENFRLRLARPLTAKSARPRPAPVRGPQSGPRVGEIRPPQPAGEAAATVADAPSVGSGRLVTVEFSSGQGVELGPAAGRPTLADGVSAPARPAGPDLPEAPDSSVIDQIARVVRANAARSGRQIIVRLNPPELGRVRLTLHAEGRDLRGVLKVEDPRTFTELQRETGALVQRLAESGVQLRRLDVDLSDDGSQGSDSGGSLARGGQGQTHGGPDDMGQQAGPDSAGEADRPEADPAPAMPDAYHVDDESINVWI